MSRSKKPFLLINARIPTRFSMNLFSAIKMENCSRQTGGKGTSRNGLNAPALNWASTTSFLTTPAIPLLPRWKKEACLSGTYRICWGIRLLKVQ